MLSGAPRTSAPVQAAPRRPKAKRGAGVAVQALDWSSPEAKLSERLSMAQKGLEAQRAAAAAALGSSSARRLVPALCAQATRSCGVMA